MELSDCYLLTLVSECIEVEGYFLFTRFSGVSTIGSKLSIVLTLGFAEDLCSGLPIG